MKIWMIAKFRLLREKDGKLEIMNKRDVNGLSVGGFVFTIGDKEVPFDWDAFVCDEDDGVFTYESGYGFAFNDFEIPDYFDGEWAEIDLSRSDITPAFLASASEIDDFYINYLDKDKNGKEIEVGVGSNSDPDIPVKIQLLEIRFEDEEDNRYDVNESVIKAFNTGIPIYES